MHVEYRNQKELPCDELYQLFYAVGWVKEDNTKDEKTTQAMMDHFNIGFIYDLAVLPEYQQKGIGKELVRRCFNACESSEWLVQTDMAKGFYEKIGFKENTDCFLTIPCKWFT